MNDSTLKCPPSEVILRYFYMELDNQEMDEIESHFVLCSKCTSSFEHYAAFINQITPSARVQKELWQISNADMFTVAAASSYDLTGTSEVTSHDGKYLLKKIEYVEDAATSLLVVKLLTPCVPGRISVYFLADSTSFFIGSELTDEDNKVCFEINSSIQLTNLLITFI